VSQSELTADSFSPDTLDFLRTLKDHEVQYLIVGGEAVIFYGHARVTGDIDFFYERSEGNARRLFAALQDFWRGTVPGMEDHTELLEPGLILQFGVPPNRIDLINQIDGVNFLESWAKRFPVIVRSEREDIRIWLIGIEDLICNKRASARPKDLDDLRFLEQRDLGG